MDLIVVLGAVIQLVSHAACGWEGLCLPKIPSVLVRRRGGIR
ncbi:hypothetical protein [Saccharothrix texasensis]|nr:hypothetical protein [Saccharothrix texasensis]